MRLFKMSFLNYTLLYWQVSLPKMYYKILKCAQCIKRSKCVVSHKQIEPKTFFSDNKYLREVERFQQFFGNVLFVLISPKKKFLVPSVYVKRRSLLSLHLARILAVVRAQKLLTNFNSSKPSNNSKPRLTARVLNCKWLVLAWNSCCWLWKIYSSHGSGSCSVQDKHYFVRKG